MQFIPFTVSDEERPNVMSLLKKSNITHSGGNPTTDNIIYIEDGCVVDFLRACKSEGIVPSISHDMIWPKVKNPSRHLTD